MFHQSVEPVDQPHTSNMSMSVTGNLALMLPGRLAEVQALPDHSVPLLPPAPVAATLPTAAPSAQIRRTAEEM
jgi:hypothetical protein